MDFACIFAICGQDPTRVTDTFRIPLPEVFRYMRALGLKAGFPRSPAFYKRVITEFRDEYLFHSLAYISKHTGISAKTLTKYVDESHDPVPRMPINRLRATSSASQDPSQRAATISDMPSEDMPSTAAYSGTLMEENRVEL